MKNGNIQIILYLISADRSQYILHSEPFTDNIHPIWKTWRKSARMNVWKLLSNSAPEAGLKKKKNRKQVINLTFNNKGIFLFILFYFFVLF